MSFDTEDTQPIGVLPTIIASPRLPVALFTQSPHCVKLSRPYTQFIVIHCTAGSESMRSAEDLAHMFAEPNLSPRRSAHYGVDGNSIVQCVQDMHTAWHAGHHANGRSIGVELCGRADQTRAQWLDGNSLPELQLAARLVATLCSRYGIPRQLLTPTEIITGKKGIATHADVSHAWPADTQHSDPGPGFPLLDFIRAVQLAG